jgi:hypothetical protein
LRTYKIEIFKQIGSAPDPNVDTLLHTGQVNEADAGEDYTATIPLEFGQTTIYTRTTDGVGNVSRVSDGRSVNRNG